MNRIAKMPVIILLSALPLAGVASAATMSMESPSSLDATVRTLGPSQFNVVTLGSLDTGDAAKTAFQDNASAHAGEVAMLHRSVEANRSLDRALKSQNVNIDDIAGAQKAADGTVTFYLR
ncbi:hypothetical protein [Rhizobium sp. NRK18]|jgi:hypothetical protein|uniref:hypothetical protein n=1 Tax=Rhizobium sp. NRK18 TaxID=2964667 RepID=UPI0021C275C8|nr:hypothetical protein [Rhizobium sp. NRK18]MCQ2004649.1 hypothetical protein [Rhizobium sp. NRK18]